MKIIMDNYGSLGVIAAALMNMLASMHCVSYQGGNDASVSDACNGGVECNYHVDFINPPMHHRFYYFEYVCAGDRPSRIPEEIIPAHGCVLLLVSDWHDQFDGCEGHCIESGWYCHHVDVERNVATIHRKYTAEENPFDYTASEALDSTTERTFPGATVSYHLVQVDVLNFRNPPVELTKTLKMLTCEHCQPGTYITLPLE